MNNSQDKKKKIFLQIDWTLIRPPLIGLAVALVIVMLMAAYIVGASQKDLQDLFLFLLGSSIPSLIFGYCIFFLGLKYLRSIYPKILLSCGIGVGVVILNIYVTSELMFLNNHDFQLLLLLLIFAATLSMPFAITFAATISRALNILKIGSNQLAQGDLSTRVKVPYHDEVNDVANAFNSMATELEEAFQRQKELEQLRRDLIAAVSHDLRTPLASVRVMVEALADQVVTDQKTVDRYHLTIQTQISNLTLLIDDLFELVKLDSGRIDLKLELGSVADLISDTLESMRAQAASKNISLQGQVDPDLPVVLMEEFKIQRVLYNLVQNAIRHTPADGSVSIIANPTTQGIQVAVADTGEGIAEDDIPCIFDEFFRGEKSRNRTTGGAGLGLAIVKRIIEAHGGSVSVSSKIEQGTIFSFVLPSYKM